MNIVDIKIEKDKKKKMEQRVRMDEFNWKPQACFEYLVPEFKIPHPLTMNVRKQLSKVLSFINLNSHRRFRDCCTIMPIPTTNKRYIDICGNHRQVSRLIGFMIDIGLIEPETIDYSYNNCCSKSKTYRYYFENEVKVIELCSIEGIEVKSISNRDTLVDSFCDVEFFDESAVRFSSALTQIRKPENWSESQFEDNLWIALYDNYEDFRYYREMSAYINETFYKDYPEFEIRYKPHFVWDTKRKFVKKIGIRATNELCSAKNDETEKMDSAFFGTMKREVLEKYGLNLHYDVKSSVPRLTYSFNKGEWLSENIDVYQLIWEEYLYLEKERGRSNIDTLVDTFSKEYRDTVKDLFMSVYFEEHSQLNMCKNIRHSMHNPGDKEQVYEEVKIFDEAVQNVLGQFYASEIFYHESNIYMEVTKRLLEEGYFVWQVYDSWYARKEGVTQEEYYTHVTELVEEIANKYIDGLYE